MFRFAMLLFIFYYAIWYVNQFLKRINPLKLLWQNNGNSNAWIRPLGKFEEFLESAHQNGLMLSSYSITINSARLLLTDDVITALLILRRKIPTLRLCIRRKKIGGDLWFHEEEQENVDFEVKTDADFETEFFGLMSHSYDVDKGPLWCVRLLPQGSDAVCPMPELKSRFPHQYKILFGFHHAITDGSSTMRICGHFIDILNDVIDKKDIDDCKQLAYFADDQRTMELTMKAGLNMALRPWEFQKYQDLVTKPITKILFLEAYPPPKECKKPQTLSLEYDLSETETSKFLKKCKSEGVTFHAAFSTVIEAAFIDMLTKQGIDKDTFVIPSFHAINLRRYWKDIEEPEKGFGVQLGMVTLVSVKGKNFMENFWDHARRFNASLRFSLEDHAPMKQAIATFLSLPGRELNVEEFANSKSKSEPYYVTTNMGNLEKIFHSEGKHVQATSIRRSTSSTATNFSHVMQTFRGRFLFGLDYEASKVSKNTAQLHLDTIFKILRTL